MLSLLPPFEDRKQNMDTLQAVREKLVRLCDEQGVNLSERVTVQPMSPDDAIGINVSGQFPIKRGKERVIEADFDGAKGQAFTDEPAGWAGTLSEMFAMELDCSERRAIFTAGLNAVLRSVGAAEGTMHCRNEDPNRCGPHVAEEMEKRFGSQCFGMIGVQPAILSAMAERFGTDNVKVVDLNPDNIGTLKSGVLVWDGRRTLARLAFACDVGLATGSSLVNGTIDEIRELFGDQGKPLVFYGNTISGAAALLGLDRICPFGR